MGTKIQMRVALRVRTSFYVALVLLLLQRSNVNAFIAPSTFGESTRLQRVYSTTEQPQEHHPAVQGWPEKYSGQAGGDVGPRILHQEFAVEKATEDALAELDVGNWPTWTTKENPKWIVGKQNVDKIMPYGELSYVIKGKLEIVTEEEVFIVSEGDFVTLPEGFSSSWKVLEELTWHYYLY